MVLKGNEKEKKKERERDRNRDTERKRRIYLSLRIKISDSSSDRVLAGRRTQQTHLEGVGVRDGDDRDNVGDDDDCGCDSGCGWQEAEVTLLQREETVEHHLS